MICSWLRYLLMISIWWTAGVALLAVVLLLLVYDGVCMYTNIYYI